MPSTVSTAHQFVVLQLLGVNAIFSVDNTAILLHHPNQLGSITTQVATGVESHVSKPLRRGTATVSVCGHVQRYLDYEGLPSNAGQHVDLTAVLRLTDEAAYTVVHTLEGGEGRGGEGRGGEGRGGREVGEV